MLGFEFIIIVDNAIMHDIVIVLQALMRYLDRVRGAFKVRRACRIAVVENHFVYVLHGF